MLKHTSIRAMHGFAYGVLLGQIVLILISIGEGDGKFYCVVPTILALSGSELSAVILQTFFTGLIGAVFAAATIIFELESWSLLKQFTIHFLITSIVWVPIAYFFWMPDNGFGIMICLGSFAITYMINWIVQYAASKKDVDEINRKIRSAHTGKSEHE